LPRPDTPAACFIGTGTRQCATEKRKGSPRDGWSKVGKIDFKNHIFKKFKSDFFYLNRIFKIFFVQAGNTRVLPACSIS